MLRSLIVIILILLTAIPVQATELSYCLLKKIGEIVFNHIEDLSQGDQDFFKTLKNNDSFYAWVAKRNDLNRPARELVEQYGRELNAGRVPPGTPSQKLVALGGYGINETDPLACAACSFLENRGVKPTMYSTRVMSLRRGDTVVVSGGKQFKLGRFLGRGNSTHVWAIDGEPGKALRLPFHVGPEPQEFIQDPELMRVFGTETAREFVLQFREGIAHAPAGIPKVEIFEVGLNNDYLVVSYVNGSERGDQFLSGLSSLADPRRASLVSRVQEIIVAKKRKYPFLKISPKSTGDVISEARQFRWDVDKKDWILADPY
ncbi:MAG: hypothetical protein ACXWPM_07280 [Bdellovibrionota bacterium]